MEKLKEAFQGSQYMTRALQYSRRMLLIYLASQHNSAISIKRGAGKYVYKYQVFDLWLKY